MRIHFTPEASMALSSQPLKLLASFLLINVSVLTICFLPLSIHAQLNPDLRLRPELNLLTTKCSRQCQSKFCEEPPLLRYGKYCGIRYSGCTGEKPCDKLDACCMRHDDCIGAAGNNYLSQRCNSKLKDCVESFKSSMAQPFEGNTCNINHVVKGIIISMDIATLPGNVIHHP